MRIERDNTFFIDSRKNAPNKEENCEVFDLDCKTSTMIHKYKDQYYTAVGYNTCAHTCATCPPPYEK
ncbi:MAG: hypothetical protein ACRCU0_07855 [Candidatus Rhabdochlamydia sp.]